MFQSQIPALSCNEKTWDEIANDYSYWRKVPEAEYDHWVDLCEELDKQIESCLGSDCFVIGDITYWRERAAEIADAELSDKQLLSLQRLLKGRFSEWRIVLQIWSDLDDGVHVGNLLIGRELFAITRGLARYFPMAVKK